MSEAPRKSQFLIYQAESGTIHLKRQIGSMYFEYLRSLMFEAEGA